MPFPGGSRKQMLISLSSWNTLSAFKKTLPVVASADAVKICSAHVGGRDLQAGHLKRH
jgi:hypothetical protein